MKNYRCSIKLRVVYPQDNFKVIVEQSKGSHDHVPVSQPKLSDQHKELMKQELDSTALIIQAKIQKTRRMGNDPLPPSIKHELARLSSYGLWIFGCRAALLCYSSRFAAKNVWMLIKRGMCYAHVKMNLKKKLQPKVMDPVRETISKDVALLQLASSTAEFVNENLLQRKENGPSKISIQSTVI
uniref:FLYWCH-type domain-containing protein n=1 Tax=Ditylenchus dipsaci TaxID=166011 RepID=A0A915DWR7_9BILA